ncbi:hypothetical protein RJ639_001205 [Escallonia herrerae]|uniref:Uncharacterized protein n=1 Tax=Escallonia herrerae TaxID=1293975 RepID=A0AA88XIL9_9ASTE|nr:hypothetical protein RJ639_001205 [Escallonia herrerae]
MAAVSEVWCEFNRIITECRKELKQKKDAMTMQEFANYNQVEENSQNLDRFELEENKSSKALIVEHGSSSGSKRKLDGQEFFENSFSRNRKSEDIVNEDQVHPTLEMGEGCELRRSKRARIEKTYGPYFYQFIVKRGRNEGDYSHMYNVEHDPLTYREAITSRDCALLQEAINDEMESIMSNQTWQQQNISNEREESNEPAKALVQVRSYFDGAAEQQGEEKQLQCQLEQRPERRAFNGNGKGDAADIVTKEHDSGLRQ